MAAVAYRTGANATVSGILRCSRVGLKRAKAGAGANCCPGSPPMLLHVKCRSKYITRCPSSPLHTTQGCAIAARHCSAPLQAAIPGLHGCHPVHTMGPVYNRALCCERSLIMCEIIKYQALWLLLQKSLAMRALPDSRLSCLFQRVCYSERPLYMLANRYTHAWRCM